MPFAIFYPHDDYCDSCVYNLDIFSVSSTSHVWKNFSYFRIRILIYKEVTEIKVNGGKNERCEGNVCTLTHRFSRALKEGQKIDLLHRARFVAPGRSQLTEFEFNGVKIYNQ